MFLKKINAFILTFLLISCLLFGLPFFKIKLFENIYVFIIFLIILYGFYIVDVIKLKKLDAFDFLYSIGIFYFLYKSLIFKGITLHGLKVSFVFFIPLIGNITKFYKLEILKLLENFKIYLEKYQNSIFLIFLFEILLGRAGSFGYIYIDSNFIEGNIINFKPQNIMISLIFLSFLYNFKISGFSMFVLSLNFILLITINRASFLMLFVFFIYLLILKKFNFIKYTLIFMTILLFSNCLDFIGFLSNNYIIDSGGKKHFSLVCNYYDSLEKNDNLNYDQLVELKNSYLNRDIPFETLPRYFSANSIFMYFGKELNNSNYLTLGSKSICKSISKDNSYINRQLTGNLNFRISIFNDVVKKNKNTILTGSNINENFIDSKFESNIYNLQLWHMHNSWLTIYGYYGILGVLVFLLQIFYLFNKKILYESNFLIIIIMFLILSLTDAVFEVPQFATFFWILIGLGSLKNNTLYA